MNRAGYVQPGWDVFGTGGAPGRMQADATRSVGVIADWNYSKGCGFVKTREGKRIFAHKTEYEVPFPDGMEPPVGTPVSYMLGRDPRSNKERACTIRIEGQAPTQGHFGVQPSMIGGYQQPFSGVRGMNQPPPQPMPVMQMQTPALPSLAPNTRWIGTLTEWNDAKACGFIECIDPPGKRLFCHKSDFANPFNDGEGPKLDTTLNFQPGFDRISGKERAQDIRTGSGRGRGNQPRLRGTLDEWNHQKACGFIVATDVPGKRFFAHKSEFNPSFADGEEPPVGTEVTFIAGFDNKSGRERAQEIKLGSGDGNTWNPRVNGTLQEWNPEKACGFIVLHGTHEGKRLFAHKSEFVEKWEDGLDPPVGSSVTCFPGVDSKSGKERAQDIRLEEGSGSGSRQRLDGTLDEWNPERACGFISCVDPPGKRLFAHKSEFAEPFEDGKEPPMGTSLTFVLGHDSKSGKERAQDIRIEGGGGAKEAKKRAGGQLAGSDSKRFREV